MGISFDQRMSAEQHVALCNHLMSEIDSPQSCDHTLAKSEAFMANAGHKDVLDSVQWLQEHGGYCDCEVIMNTVPWDEIEAHAS